MDPNRPFEACPTCGGSATWRDSVTHVSCHDCEAVAPSPIPVAGFPLALGGNPSEAIARWDWEGGAEA